MENGKDKRLVDLAASYGANPAHWPVEDQAGLINTGSDAFAEAREIDLVLNRASSPALPEGAEARLLSRIDEGRSAEVILFRPKPRQAHGWMPVAAALPLAASLALGIYLGAAGNLDFMLPASVTGDVASVNDTVDDLGGVGEADAYSEENLT